MTCTKSFSPSGFFQLQVLYKAGFTAVESDYAGIASQKSSLHRKSLPYEITPVSSHSFSYRVYRIDAKDLNPVNVDLYTVTLTGSAAMLSGPSKPPSGHHLHDLPPHIWGSLPTTSLYLDVASSTILISSSVRL